MIVLGIEGTAHTASIGVVDGKKVLCDVKDMYRPKEGIIPHEAGQHHKKVFPELLNKLNFDLSKVDLIAYSRGPGLSPCLVETKRFAEDLALDLDKPLIGVNHLIGHLSIGLMLTKMKNPVFILATGANTQIIALEGNRYRIFGECLSIGLGNALDKFGRGIGISFPAGPKIEELAKKGEYVELPYVVKGMDVEFSGIVTRAVDLYKKGIKKEDLCYSLQENCFSMLTEVSERALAHTQKKELLLIGGVAANKRLIEMLKIMCKERGCKFDVVPLEYSGDCGAQIAVQGFLEKKNGLDDINPRWRIDEVEITYT